MSKRPTTSARKCEIFVEAGKHRTFAGALDWPGWCRSGRDEAAAAEALLAHGPRHERALRSSALTFHAPTDLSVFEVVERLEGNATTDFGAPDRELSSDAAPLDATGLLRIRQILDACWRALDEAIDAAAGKTLATGPRGGGRPLDGIFEHVVGAEHGYLSRLGGKALSDGAGGEPAEVVREAILRTLEASSRGEIEAVGPRGGRRVSARYFAPREAWHVLDHVWEIEDRVAS